MSVLENLLVAMQRGELGSPLTDVASSRTSAQAQTARALLSYVGYRGSIGRLAGDLPHIDKRLLEIARALALRPRILMLDEPAAGLNLSDKQLLAKLLRRIADAGIAVVLIEHDMSLVMGISDHIAVLDAGKQHRAGTPGRGAQRSGSHRGVSGRRAFRHAAARARLATGRGRATCRARSSPRAMARYRC